jgi:hypothetical protein
VRTSTIGTPPISQRVPTPCAGDGCQISWVTTSATQDVTATDEQVARFQDDGFLRLEQIISAEEVAYLRQLYDRVMANARAFRVVYEGDGGRASMINQVFLPELQAPELADSGYLRNGRRVIAALLRVDEGEVNNGGHPGQFAV